MTQNLYEITAEFRMAEEHMIASGMDEQTIKDTLEGISFEFDEKVRNIARLIKNQESLVVAIKNEEKSMKERRGSLERGIERLKDYIKAGMINIGKMRINFTEFSVEVRNNTPSVCIENESEIPGGFMRYPSAPPPEVDKNKIALAIKNGTVVPGAVLTRTQRLEIK